MSSTGVQGGAGAGSAPALRFEGVSFTYRGAGRPALVDLDLEVAPGEWLALVGGNGSGKSTLAHLANGLLRPQKGRVLVGGFDTRASDHLWQVRARVGLLFQDPENQIVAASVEDDVAFGLENLGVPRETMRRRVGEALAEVGLTGEECTEPHLLSGGQKQRLALAGVLALEPRVLILDEPTSMLDPRGREEALAWVRRSASRGVAVVLITQHMDEALPADRLVALDGGRVVYDGAVYPFFRSRTSRLPLGVPAALGLAEELSRRGFPAPAPDGEAVPGAGMKPLTEDELVAELAKVVTVFDGRPPASLRRGATRAGAAEAVGLGRRTFTVEGESPAVAADPEFVALRGVRLVYAEGAPFARVALDGADLTLREGLVTAVVGPTAAGKSSLLEVCAGLLKPSAGEVSFKGRLRPLSGEVGMVFQRAEIQLFCATVEEDVGVAPKLRGLRGEALRRRIDAALRTTGLDPESFRDRSPHGLSMGERRRVALAGILALEPRVLILDEPGAGLDPDGRVRLMGLLARWVGAARADTAAGDAGMLGYSPVGGARTSAECGGGRTLVFTSHDMDEVAELAQRVVLMAGGAILAEGPADRILGDEQLLSRAGLRPPLAARVAGRLGASGSWPVTAGALADWLRARERVA